MFYIIFFICFFDYGGFDVLFFFNIELFVSGLGEIQICYVVIGVNYIDIYYCKGVFGFKLLLLSGLGVEGVGEIVVVGFVVFVFKVGDCVVYVGGLLGGYVIYCNFLVVWVIYVFVGLDSVIVVVSVFKGLIVEYLIYCCVSLQLGDMVLFYVVVGGVGFFVSQWFKVFGVIVIGIVMYD